MVLLRLPFDIPKRLNIGVMLFVVCLMSYMMRVNLSVIIIAMVQPSKIDLDNTPADYGPRYDWSQKDQGFLLGAYFYGYLLSSLPSGAISERFGGKVVAGYCALLSGILTLGIPLFASSNFWGVFVLRLLIGFFGGTIYPSCHNLISKWSPPDERGKFVASLMGGTFGTVITWPLCGIVIENFGWDWAFYLAGIFVIVMSVLWFIVVDDSPATHTTISQTEKEYIEKSLGDNLSEKKKMPPYKSVITSLPFWGLLILHYGNTWGLFFLLTAAPKFMSEALGFDLKSAGFLSSLPHLMRLIAAFAFGAVADSIRSKDLMSVTAIRKLFCILSHIIPGLCLIALAFYGNGPYLCVAIMTMSLGFNGAATATNLQNAQDLAPNYAATLYGIINFIGTTPGIFSPMLVAYFTKDQSTLNEWRKVFLIGAFAYISSAIIYFFIGSGKVQKWNENKKDPSKGDTVDVVNTKL